MLRGIALFGVMAINITSEFRVSIFEQFLSHKHPASPLDRAVETILTLAVDLKAFALFSLLFGIGLAIQFERLSASPRRTVLLVRRLIVLLAFGLIHLCLIWNGDILTEYALAGLFVLPFLFGPRWLLAVGAAAFLLLYLALQIWMPSGVFPDFAALTQDVADANRIYATGGFADVQAFRLREIRAHHSPAHLRVRAHDRTVSARRLRLARRPVARRAGQSSRVLFAIGRERNWSRRGIDPRQCRRDFHRPDGCRCRSARHRPAGAGIRRRHHRHANLGHAARRGSAGPRRWGAWPSPTTSRNP